MYTAMWLQVIPAFEEAILGMKTGGVRRIIVPVELGYPGQPPDFNKLGPAPGNFSVSFASDICIEHVQHCGNFHFGTSENGLSII